LGRFAPEWPEEPGRSDRRAPAFSNFARHGKIRDDTEPGGHELPVSHVVRDVEPSDRSRWEPLWRSYQGRRRIPDAVTEITWQRFLDATEPVHALVVQEDEALIGFVHYLFHRSTARVHPTCYLQDMFTVPERRGRGVGRALIQGVCERAKAAGAYRVYWITGRDNTVARALYGKVATLTNFVQYRIDF
jgi:GNAT superfamily N-acetyltransferase